MHALISADGGLRQETLFPRAVYWWSMVSDAVARFAWVVFILPIDKELAPFIEAVIVRALPLASD